MNNWVINQKDFPNKDAAYIENIFSLGNGYMGVRGFDEFADWNFEQDYNTFIAGVFDYFTSNKTDMVNTPNYWHTNLWMNKVKFSKGNGNFIESNMELDMKKGILKKKQIWKDNDGKETQIETVRFLSLDSVHTAVLNINIIPLNYSGYIEIETGIDAHVWNNIIDDDQMKSDTNMCNFLNEDGNGYSLEDFYILKLKTKRTDIKIYEGFTTELLSQGQKVEYRSSSKIQEKYMVQKSDFPVCQGQIYTFTKYISVWSSRDSYSGSLEEQVLESLKEYKDKGFDVLLKNHIAVWDLKWKCSDIEIQGDDRCQKAIRYNVFQLIQTNAENDSWVNIGARGIMHSRYKGCYFWDTEIFMLPFYLFTNPKAAKNLLMYRYNTLNGAMENAKRQNLEGARYAWMSALDGIDQCDTWDIGLSEVHITADIAFAINQYYEATNDIDFIKDFGLEILIQTARYWKSRFTYERASDKYNLLFVKGPNEYGGVINNNLYTVMMACLNIQLAEKYIDLIKVRYSKVYENLARKINFCENEINNWQEICQKVVINYDKDKRLYLEDDNFLKLEPLDLCEVKKDEEPLYKNICFDRLQRYRVLKQADVILLMYLCPSLFTGEEKKAAWSFYEPITTHDSSLSYGTHAAFAAKLGLEDEAYSYFIKSVCLDLDDVMDSTKKEGVHFGALGASWGTVFNGFAGIEIMDGNLSINPNLPKDWTNLSFRFFYHQCVISISISQSKIEIRYEEGTKKCIEVKIRDTMLILRKTKKFSIPFEEVSYAD